jgi:hypothetical protein
VLQAEALGAWGSHAPPAAACGVADSEPRRPLPLGYHALGQVPCSAARRDIAAAHGLTHVPPVHGPAANPAGSGGTSRLTDEGYRLAAGRLANHGMRPAPGPRMDMVTARLRAGSAR